MDGYIDSTTVYSITESYNINISQNIIAQYIFVFTMGLHLVLELARLLLAFSRLFLASPKNKLSFLIPIEYLSDLDTK